MSADADFKEFVERQLRPAPSDAAPDWNRERDEWLVQLQQLYDRIREYLDEYIQNDTIKLRESMIELNEENIGVYSAKRMTIVIGAQEILLTPVGTLLIGSKGRVDVEGSAGHSRLVLLDKTIIHPRQMFRVTVTTIPAGGSMPQPPELPSASEDIEWTWKIVSRPPAMRFIELSKDTFYEMLLEVSNG